MLFNNLHEIILEFKERKSYLIIGLMLILFQCSFILPSKGIFLTKIIFPTIILFVSVKENKMSIKNNLFVFWLIGFYLVCIASMLYFPWTENMLNTFFSLSFCFLMLFAISQHIQKQKDIENIINFMAIGGIIYAAYIFINQYDTIFIKSIDPQYTNGTIMQFTYVMIPTTYYLIYKFVNASDNKYRLIYGMLVGFAYLMCIISGRRKAFVFPLLFFGLLILFNKKRNFTKIFIIFIALLGIGFGSYYMCLHNEILYNLIGYRINSLILFVSGDELVDKSAWARSYLSATAWSLFQQNPFTGVGLGNFIYNNKLDYYAHNNYLELICDLGIFGLVAYYWLHLYTIIKLICIPNFWHEKLARFLLFGLLLNMLHDFGTISYYRIYFNIFICLASVYVSIKNEYQ